MTCPQCEGTYTLKDHQTRAGARVVSVVCNLCHVPREIWFKQGSAAAN